MEQTKSWDTHTQKRKQKKIQNQKRVYVLETHERKNHLEMKRNQWTQTEEDHSKSHDENRISKQKEKELWRKMLHICCFFYIEKTFSDIGSNTATQQHTHTHTQTENEHENKSFFPFDFWSIIMCNHFCWYDDQIHRTPPV